MPPNGARKKRSHSIPAANSETSGIAAFFSRRSSGGGMSSASAAKGRKRKGSLMQPIQEEVDHLREILPIPFKSQSPGTATTSRGRKCSRRRPGERACNSCSTRGRQKNSVLFQD
ncbi:hypothetical protein CDAR_402331 [Caerostris darwini]|uniref:Uncharacterized protein n=1 Tax=Caerostris darwini TaxID=1538125 RepID=A0AAV4R0M6_9ARAC|nr:hypothetical protein CDAR_402331 [Caerostris darwini]